jgi:hypothetical protein
MMLEASLLLWTETMSISLSEMTMTVVANEADEGAENDAQQKSPPKAFLMKPGTTATALFQLHLPFRFQAASFFRDNSVFFGLSQIHGIPLV